MDGHCYDASLKRPWHKGSIIGTSSWGTVLLKTKKCDAFINVALVSADNLNEITSTFLTLRKFSTDVRTTGFWIKW